MDKFGFQMVDLCLEFKWSSFRMVPDFECSILRLRLLKFTIYPSQHQYLHFVLVILGWQDLSFVKDKRQFLICSFVLENLVSKIKKRETDLINWLMQISGKQGRLLQNYSVDPILHGNSVTYSRLDTSRLSRSSMARVSCTGLVTVGPT